MSKITATRYHDFSAGHRVHGHEGKCAHLHGHNYRVHFTVEGHLDMLGRVIDFSAIKDRLCNWLEANWDHKMLIGTNDPLLPGLVYLDHDGIIEVPFNPTAENMANYLLTQIAPMQLEGTGVTLIHVSIEETRKCSASSEL